MPVLLTPSMARRGKQLSSSHPTAYGLNNNIAGSPWLCGTWTAGHKRICCMGWPLLHLLELPEQSSNHPGLLHK